LDYVIYENKLLMTAELSRLLLWNYFLSIVCRSKFVPPKLTEGFCEIVNVNFVPQFDKNSKHATAYRHFLMEKWLTFRW